MADSYVFTQSDTRPFMAVTIKNSLTGAVVDLTGATVTFNFRLSKPRAKTAKVSSGACTVTSTTGGQVEYRWGATDLDIPGIYTAEFQVTHTDTKVQTVVIENVEVRAQEA